MLYFSRYVHSNSIQCWVCIIVNGNDYMLYKVLDKMKEIIDIGNFDDELFWLIQMVITLQDVAILMAYVVKEDGKSYQLIFLKEALFVK